MHTLAEFKTQTFEDGLFHLAMWVTTIAGVTLLFRATAHSAYDPRAKALLGIHHVIAGSPHQLTVDLLFLGALMLVLFGTVLSFRTKASIAVDNPSQASHSLALSRNWRCNLLSRNKFACRGIWPRV
jgi:uncharacterized membrane protein